MNFDFNSLMQNPFFQQAFSFIGEQLLSKSFQEIRKLFKSSDAHALLASQLLFCLTQAYKSTCDHFGWEWEDSVIEELLSKQDHRSFNIQLHDDLVNILRSVSGSDVTGIVDDEVVTYWLNCFFENLACKQELHNFLNQYKGEKQKFFPNADNSDYQKSFCASLFLEAGINDGKEAQLKDVYVPAKYKVNLLGKEKRIDFATMLISFFNKRETFRWQQDDSCSPVSDRIFAIMIMGKPGSGKSSFVSYLSTLLPDAIGPRPLFIIRLRNMQRSQINADDPIQGLLDYMETDRNGLVNSVVILDGLDEVCALYQKTDFHIYLKKLLHHLSTIRGLQLLITSRTGYFRVDSAMENFCLTLHIEDWDNDDLDLWSEKYKAIHPCRQRVIESNNLHLKEEKYSDKKAIFAVPILFYMANARGKLLSEHQSICSVYDAVLSEVSDERHYDVASYISVHELIPGELARQICIEIAFSMFRTGRLNYNPSIPNDPYLYPEEVDAALLAAIQRCNSAALSLSAEEKQKIKNTYALTFYYNEAHAEHNAVEFAHKTIAEYFASEKMWEIMCSLSDETDETPLCDALAECFGYAPVTADILLFLKGRITIEKDTKKIARIKRLLEKHFLCSVLDGKIFSQPQNYPSDLHYMDRVSIMVRSVLMLFEYLDCQPPRPSEEQQHMFNNVIASVARMATIRFQHRSLLPLALNGFNLSNGDFTACELSEAHLAGADLTHAIFTDANLTDGQLSECIMTTTDFSGANLAGADLTNIKNAHAVEFTEAAIQGADFSESFFVDASFEHADMQETILENCTFGAGCNLNEANMYMVIMDGADISKASIEGTVFKDEENEEDEPFTISGLTLTQQQYDYISTFSTVELKNCMVVTPGKSKRKRHPLI